MFCYVIWTLKSSGGLAQLFPIYLNTTIAPIIGTINTTQKNKAGPYESILRTTTVPHTSSGAVQNQYLSNGMSKNVIKM